METEDLVKLVKEAYENNNIKFFGIRHLTEDENYEIGDIVRNSYDWDYESDCSTYDSEPVELNGACAVDTQISPYADTLEEIAEKIRNTANECLNAYMGNGVVLIGGQGQEYGQDENEIIISCAKVIAFIG